MKYKLNLKEEAIHFYIDGQEIILSIEDDEEEEEVMLSYFFIMPEDWGKLQKEIKKLTAMAEIEDWLTEQLGEIMVEVTTYPREGDYYIELYLSKEAFHKLCTMH